MSDWHTMTPEQRRERREEGYARVKQMIADLEERDRERRRLYRQRDKYRPRTASRRVHRFVAASGAQGGRVLTMSGCDLRRFHANPVVLHGHDKDQVPVGRADLFVDEGCLVADVTFDRRDPLGRSLDRKYRRGFMHAVSLGYEAYDYRIDELGVFLVGQWEPFELSAVSVPADHGAVVLTRATRLPRWLRR